MLILRPPETFLADGLNKISPVALPQQARDLTTDTNVIEYRFSKFMTNVKSCRWATRNCVGAVGNLHCSFGML